MIVLLAKSFTISTLELFLLKGVHLRLEKEKKDDESKSVFAVNGLRLVS